MRYKITGSNQYKYANKKCCSIYNYYQWYIYLHRCHVDIVCRRIEFDKSCMYLYKYKPNTYNVAKYQTASNNEDCKPKECAPYSWVGRSKSFKLGLKPMSTTSITGRDREIPLRWGMKLMVFASFL